MGSEARTGAELVLFHRVFPGRQHDVPWLPHLDYRGGLFVFYPKSRTPNQKYDNSSPGLEPQHSSSRSSAMYFPGWRHRAISRSTPASVSIETLLAAQVDRLDLTCTFQVTSPATMSTVMAA